MQITEYFGDWLNVIDVNEMMIALNAIKPIKSIIEPNYSDIFKAFTLCTLHDTKVVFLGQDPYPQKGVATGIAFANNNTVNISPSLEVLKEACIDYSVPHDHVEFDITLESWGRQGILLLNSSLTVQRGSPNSHSMIWRPFISKLLSNMQRETGIIYVLFGTQAQTFKPYIDERFNNIIEVYHPAYYARIGKDMPHKLFVDIDKLLIDKYGETIEWYKS